LVPRLAEAWLFGNENQCELRFSDFISKGTMLARIRPVGGQPNVLANLAWGANLKFNSLGAKEIDSSPTNCLRNLMVLAGPYLSNDSLNHFGSKWRSDLKTTCPDVTARRTYVQVSPTEFYDIMGLTPKATPGEIKATYFKLSKIYHPDVCKDPAGVEKFVLISKAYEVLGNEEKRREYDRGIVNPLDEKSGRAATRAQQEFTHEDVLRYQEIFNQHHDMPKSKRSQFVQRGKKHGVYDFDEYYKQHYQDELKKQHTSMRENDNMNKNAEETVRTRKQQDFSEDEQPQVTGVKAIGPWIAIMILVYVTKKWGIL